MADPSPEVESHRLSADGPFPNNPHLPLLVYRQALGETGRDVVDAFQRLLESHQWGGTWVNGVFAYHHYHSNAHEVLVVCAGNARIQFGGPGGPIVSVAAGDVAILPAGTAHKRIDASVDFLVVGGYPAGQEDYDLIRDDPSAKAAAAKRIASVAVPSQDALYGEDGPLQQHWVQ
jgi:uncharacterized protein YjlB